MVSHAGPARLTDAFHGGERNASRFGFSAEHDLFCQNGDERPLMARFIWRSGLRQGCEARLST
jgi:hypothetical protein